MARPEGDPSGSFTPNARSDKVTAVIRKRGLPTREERNMYSNFCKGLLAVALMGTAQSAFANVITDWDEKGIAAVRAMSNLGGTNPYLAQRMMAMVHAAMFDAVNSIERRYRPYLAQLPADPTTSKEAAAAAAVLTTIGPKTADEMKVALAIYLGSIADGTAKSDGVKLGPVYIRHCATD
jgi:hypothetical protein